MQQPLCIVLLWIKPRDNPQWIGGLLVQRSLLSITHGYIPPYCMGGEPVSLNNTLYPHILQIVGFSFFRVIPTLAVTVFNEFFARILYSFSSSSKAVIYHYC